MLAYGITRPQWVNGNKKYICILWNISNTYRTHVDKDVASEKKKLEQLERLRSEDTPRRPMITPSYWPVYFKSQVHIIDQLISDPKSKQGESWKIRKICEKFKF